MTFAKRQLDEYNVPCAMFMPHVIKNNTFYVCFFLLSNSKQIVYGTQVQQLQKRISDTVEHIKFVIRRGMILSNVYQMFGRKLEVFTSDGEQ